MKVAVFGGSFDPPHIGHDLIIKSAFKSLDIDKLFIIPTYINPFKKGFVADENTRLAWVKKLWGSLEKVEFLDYEVRAKRPVPSIESVYFTDFVILTTSLTQRHALSLIDELKTQLKGAKEEFLSIESSEDWSVIDLGDIIIHLLSQDYRAKYNIEELLKSLQEQKS